MTWRGVRLVLLPDRAMLLPDVATLIVADVHLGKPASFRASGVPVPEGVTARDLGRLSGLIATTEAKRLIILGDLVHDGVAFEERTGKAVRDWRYSLSSVEVDLVPGNHDRKASSFESLGVREIATHAALEVAGCRLELTHEPVREPRVPTLCGHVHPAVSVGARRSVSRVRSSCFWFDGDLGILPAFGSFTGGKSMGLRDGVAAFAAGERGVIPVTEAARQFEETAGDQEAHAYDLG